MANNYLQAYGDESPHGLLIPGDIAEQIKSNPEALHEADKEKNMRMNKERYPNMPAEDAEAIHRLSYNLFLAPTVPFNQDWFSFAMRIYVMDTHTDFKLQAPLEDKDAIGEAYRKATEIMVGWKGDQAFPPRQ